MTTIGAAIPTIPPRAEFLRRALESVYEQTRKVDAVSVVIDSDREGAPATRNRAWRKLNTDWVAFLDDDDYWYPKHIELTLRHAEETDADVVYPWYDCLSDPFPQFEGKPWSNDGPHLFPICYIVKRELLEEVGGFPEPLDGPMAGEDWPVILRYVALGAKIEHLNERTWKYEHWGGNTSGQPTW